VPLAEWAEEARFDLKELAYELLRLRRIRDGSAP
jgi:hypothetical protein